MGNKRSKDRIGTLPDQGAKHETPMRPSAHFSPKKIERANMCTQTCVVCKSTTMYNKPGEILKCERVTERVNLVTDNDCVANMVEQSTFYPKTGTLLTTSAQIMYQSSICIIVTECPITFRSIPSFIVLPTLRQPSDRLGFPHAKHLGWPLDLLLDHILFAFIFSNR